MPATDYNTGCGDVALSFYQMMAACIVGYSDHYRLNLLEVSGDCIDLHDLVDCDINHVEAERLLVENAFALDECSRLALKVFNSTSAINDYSECGEVPQTFLQMLARTLVGYHDISGVMHYRINTISTTDHCDTLTDLLDCDTNDIEAERMIVENLFCLDDCDRLAIKIFNNVGAIQGEGVEVDYNTSCTTFPQSFLQMLARCIVLYGDAYKLNIMEETDNCDDLTDFWTCSNNHIDPERALVENLFATDECGHLALKWFNNSGEA